MQIKYLKAREILDSRGYPTIETYLQLSDGNDGIGGVPSGASTGDTEVLELRDGDKSRYGGKGVLSAVKTVNEVIFPAVQNREFATQADLDNFLIALDGTELKTKLGGNSILSVSMAFCRAGAKAKRLPLYRYFAEQYYGDANSPKVLERPQPMILIMEGGAHGAWSTDFQEYMIVPRIDKFSSYSESLRAGAEIFHAVHDILHERGISTGVGFEGAFSPNEMKSNKDAFDVIMSGIERAGYKPGEQITMALDIAASEFYNRETGRYDLKKEKVSLTREEWIDLQSDWFSQYPIWSIEDMLNQEDWAGWPIFMQKFGKTHQIVGDDFLTTNVKRIAKASEVGAVNSVLIKLNQIGSVTETLNAIKMTEQNGWTAVISHRGGETNDDMIADLTYGTYANQTKFGGPDRGERLAKYNRALQIESDLLGV